MNEGLSRRELLGWGVGIGAAALAYRPLLAGESLPAALWKSWKERTGLDDAWETAREHRAALAASGALDDKRAAQAEAFLWHAARDDLEIDLRRVQHATTALAVRVARHPQVVQPAATP